MGYRSAAEMVALDASAVAALLVELGRRTALAGDNYFRAKAYQRAADRLLALVEPLDRIIAEDRLRELPGIGETIAPPHWLSKLGEDQSTRYLNWNPGRGPLSSQDREVVSPRVRWGG